MTAKKKINIGESISDFFNFFVRAFTLINAEICLLFQKKKPLK